VEKIDWVATAGAFNWLIILPATETCSFHPFFQCYHRFPAQPCHQMPHHDPLLLLLFSITERLISFSRVSFAFIPERWMKVRDINLRQAFSAPLNVPPP
jgi:hypothetical protein